MPQVFSDFNITLFRILRRSYIVFVVAFFSFVMLAFASPSISYAEPTADELISEVSALKASVSASQSEYLSSLQKAAELESQQKALAAEIVEIETSIENKKEKLAQMLVNEYKSPTARSIIVALSEADSLESALRQVEYASLVVESRANTIAEIRHLRDRAQEALEEAEIKREYVVEASDAAKAATSDWGAKLDEIKPKVSALRDKYWSKVATSSGADQLNAALSYLEDVEGLTSTQAELLKSAYSTGYAGADRCESWTEAVYRNAGIKIGQYIGAAQAAQALTKSEDLDVIPVGALVFGSGSGSSMGKKYGHVGICVASGTGKGDALILDNEGSRKKKAVPLDEWSSWQVSTSWVSGKQGAFAWGYPDSIELSPSKTGSLL